MTTFETFHNIQIIKMKSMYVKYVYLLIYRFIVASSMYLQLLTSLLQIYSVISIVLSFSKTTNAAAKPLVTEDGSLQLDMQRIMDVASQVEFSNIH